MKVNFHFAIKHFFGTDLLYKNDNLSLVKRNTHFKLIKNYALYAL